MTKVNNNSELRRGSIAHIKSYRPDLGEVK